MTHEPLTVDLLIVGAKLITLDEERRIFEDGAVAIDRGEVVAVDRTADIAQAFRARETLNANGGLVHPGLIDAHVHSVQQLSRSSIPDTMTLAEEHRQWVPYWNALDPEACRASALLAMLEMAHNGTTTFVDMGGNLDVTAPIAAEVGLRAVLSATYWDQPRISGVSVPPMGEQLEGLEQDLRKYPKAGRVSAGAGLTGMGRCSDAMLMRAKDLANTFGVQLYLHLSFGPADTEAVISGSGGKRPVDHLDALGLLAPNLTLIHAIHLDEAEIHLLKDHEVRIVHCPGASAKFGAGAPTIGSFPTLLNDGVHVGIGSDASNFADALDLLRLAYLTVLLHREASAAGPTITAERALEMLTIHGAAAAGLDSYVGKIAPGMAADIVMHGRSRSEAVPMHDPLTNLLYSSQSKTIDTVLVGGKKVVTDGRVSTLDETAALEEINEIAKSLHARMMYEVPRRWPVVAG
jgi:5-methylthioadenosine/S-adenosylhomocysteine deaminase